jgi:hypothetical protein
MGDASHYLVLAVHRTLNIFSYLTNVTNEIKALSSEVKQLELEANHSLQLVPRLRMCGTLQHLLYTFIAYCFYIPSRMISGVYFNMWQTYNGLLTDSL